MLEIFTRDIFFQSLFELEVVYSTCFNCCKMFFLKMKNKSPKRYEPPKKKKILHMIRDTRKSFEKKGKMKNEGIRRV